jgi:hypothetical protein
LAPAWPLLGPVAQTALLESWCPVAVTPAEVLNPRLRFPS